MSRSGTALAIIATLMAVPRLAAAQTYGRPGGRLVLHELRMTVPVPDQSFWTAESRHIGNGIISQVVTGLLDGGTFQFVATPAGALSCTELMGTAAARPGARSVGDPAYAPVPQALPVIENNGLGTYCLPMFGNAVVFSVRLSQLTTPQQASIRSLLQAIADAGSSGPLPPGAAQEGLTSAISLRQVGLWVPINPDMGWLANTTDGPDGTRLDQVTRQGRGGFQSLTLTRRPDASSCAAELAAVAGGRVRESSDYFPAPWVSSSSASNGRLTGCLTLNQGVLLATITRSDERLDQGQMRLLLIGVRLAAAQQWGAP